MDFGQDEPRPTRPKSSLWSPQANRSPAAFDAATPAAAPRPPVHTEHHSHSRGKKLAQDASKDANGADTGTEKNHDLCDACGDGGELLCCDNCPNAFHFECVFPPLDPNNLPDGDWFCNTCSYKVNSRRANMKRDRAEKFGPLKKVYEFIVPQNPRVFTLPLAVKRAVNAGMSRKNEIKSMDMIPMLRFPEQSVARYTPDEKDPRKGKGKCCHICASNQDDHLVKCFQCRKHYHRYCVEPMALSVGMKWMCPEHEGHISYNLKQYKMEQEDEDDDDGIYEPEAIRLDYNEKSLPSFCRPDGSDEESSSEDPRPKKEAAPAAPPSRRQQNQQHDNSSFRPPQPVATMSERDRRSRERASAASTSTQGTQAQSPSTSGRSRSDERNSAMVPIMRWTDQVSLDMTELVARQYEQLLEFSHEKSAEARESKRQQYVQMNETFWSGFLNEPARKPPGATQALSDSSPLREFVASMLNGPVGEKNPYFSVMEPNTVRDATTSIDFSAFSENPMKSMLDMINNNPQLRDYLALQRLSQVIHQVHTELCLAQLPPHVLQSLTGRQTQAKFPVRNTRAMQNIMATTKKPQQLPATPKPISATSAPPPSAARGVKENMLLPLSPVTIVARTQSAPQTPVEATTATTVKRSAPDSTPPMERPAKRLKTGEEGPGSLLATPGTPMQLSSPSTPLTPSTPTIAASSGVSPTQFPQNTARSLLRSRTTSSNDSASQPSPSQPQHFPPASTPVKPATEIAKSSSPVDSEPLLGAPIVITPPPIASESADDDVVVVKETQPFVWPQVPEPPKNSVERPNTRLRGSPHWPTSRPPISPAIVIPHPRLAGQTRFAHYDESGRKIIAVLTWKDQHGTEHSATLNGDSASSNSIRFGRSHPNAEIDVTKYTEARTASHQHAELRFDVVRGKFILDNFGRNGSRVNGQIYGKISGDPGDKVYTEIVLEDLDEMMIGHVPFTLHALCLRQPQPSKKEEVALAIQYANQRM